MVDFKTIKETAGDVAEGASQGLSFGYIDEVLAALGSKIYGISYDEALKAARDITKEAEERSPIATTLGEIGGAVGSGIGATAGLAKAGVQVLPKATTALGKLGQLAGRSAVETGLYASGKSEEGLGSKEFMQDVAQGAVLGATAPVAVAGAGKLVTRGIPLAARSKLLAGLSKEQAGLYGDYLEDITKWTADRKTMGMAIHNIKTLKAGLDSIKGISKEVYGIGATEKAGSVVVPFAKRVIEKMEEDSLPYENLYDAFKVLRGNKKLSGFVDKVEDLLNNPEALGRDVLNLRKEADMLVGWDRKASLLPEEERVLKAVRQGLKEVSTPHIKAADSMFKIGVPYKSLRNKFLDKNGKPTGFYNRLEEGKLKKEELDWVKSNFLTLGSNLKNALSDMPESEIKKELTDLATRMSAIDKTGRDALEKAYKFMEFQRTGSLRDISKLVKVGGATTLGSPLAGILVAMADTPASVLRFLSQFKGPIATAQKGASYGVKTGHRPAVAYNAKDITQEKPEFNWEDFEEESQPVRAENAPQSTEQFNWDEYEEEPVEAAPAPTDERLNKYKEIVRSINPNATDVEIEENYNKYSGKTRKKMNETNAAFGVK